MSPWFCLIDPRVYSQNNRVIFLNLAIFAVFKQIFRRQNTFYHLNLFLSVHFSSVIYINIFVIHLFKVTFPHKAYPIISLLNITLVGVGEIVVLLLFFSTLRIKSKHITMAWKPSS